MQRYEPGNRLHRSLPIVTITALTAAAASHAAADVAGGPETAEHVTIFVQPEATALWEDFESDHLPALRASLGALGLTPATIDVSAGAPPEVHITPLIVYQNHRGRAIYQGRFNTPGRLEGFVRTARSIPQAPRPRTVAGAPFARRGRAVIAAPIKVTGLGGTIDGDHDAAAFEADARTAIRAGFEHLGGTDAVLTRSDRAFYLDFYPYRSGDMLHVSTAIFSQFNCHDPVFRSKSRSPVSGPWSERHRVFAEAGRTLEARLLEQLDRATTGDGFSPVADDVAPATWESLGLALPPPPADTSAAIASDIALPTTWTLPVPAGDAGSVSFAFAAPMDFYTGSAPTVTAELSIDPDRLAAATGLVTVETGTVTMGEADLDAAVRDAPILDVATHPTSTFRIDSIEIARGVLAFGERAEGVMRGTFSLRGRDLPLAVLTSFEPTIGADGRPRLIVVATWTIRLLDPFGIVGPDGPEPAKDTVLFTASFEFEPAAD